MKTKPAKQPASHTAMPRLHQAVIDIVEATRRVFVEQERAAGGDGRNIDLRLPVLFGGTDMRCTIEAGPSTARRNVIENVQMEANGKPTDTNRDRALRDAINLLTDYASEIKADFCDTTGNWENAYSMRAFERCVAAVRALDHLAMEGGQ